MRELDTSTPIPSRAIGRRWRAFMKHFDGVRVPPERDFAGPELEAGTGVAGARVRGVHLRLPGFGADGPTLEIFSFAPALERGTSPVNQPDFGHIAFRVDSVTEARAEVLGAGGRAVGEIVTLTTAGSTRITWCYVTDPEGNVIELQSWS